MDNMTRFTKIAAARWYMWLYQKAICGASSLPDELNSDPWRPENYPASLSPGNTFEVASIETSLGGPVVTVWALSDDPKLREDRGVFLQHCHALVWVVDACDRPRINESAAALQRTLDALASENQGRP